MSNKVLGYGSIVKVDHDDNASFTTVGCIKEITPPPRRLKEVDGTCLEDVRESIDPGIAEATDFVFTQVWKVGEAAPGYIDLLFTNAKARTTPYDVDWQVIYPQDTPVTEAFTGWVKEISPSVKGNSEYWTRQVTVKTTSVSTLS